MRMKGPCGAMIGVGLGLFAAGCADTGAPPPAGEVLEPPAIGGTTGEAAGRPAARTARDIDRDGFVSASEAAGFYARRFGVLDEDGDGLLSRDELAAAHPGVDDPDAVFSEVDSDADELVSQGEYFEAGADRFRQRANPNTGMMSTSDFDSMVRFADAPAAPEIDPEAEVLPRIE